MTTPPRQGSVNGEYGFPALDMKRIRVFVGGDFSGTCGDMPRGVAAWSIEKLVEQGPAHIAGIGWADVLTYDEQGVLVMNGAGGFVTRRVTGKVEVKAV